MGDHDCFGRNDAAAFECRRCPAPLGFRRRYEPAQFLEGYPDARTWIVGLNPAVDESTHAWSESLESLRDSLLSKRDKHRYFRRFRSVSMWLYTSLGVPGGVAHTDLVRCGSPRFQFDGRVQEAAIQNCRPYLEQQIAALAPRLLIANGAPVADSLRSVARNVVDAPSATSFDGEIGGRPVTVVLSGFIQQLDRFACRRLGREIEDRAARLGLLVLQEPDAAHPT